ncbi:MAG: ABC-type transport system involved in multi-copper enzyme maturation permease subunit [Gammaproteobacteria bacterium]|jgi:ABC-type transport system involved in multi-copper enzyme maturation permease subunit
MTTESRQFVYGITAIVGIFVTWYFNIQFMVEYGGNLLFFAAWHMLAACLTLFLLREQDDILNFG